MEFVGILNHLETVGLFNRHGGKYIKLQSEGGRQCIPCNCWSTVAQLWVTSETYGSVIELPTAIHTDSPPVFNFSLLHT